MADTPDPQARRPMQMAVTDTPHAPIIYFENAPALGFLPGVIRLTLSTGVTIPDGEGGVRNDEVIVCYLRCNIPAALSLRKAIDDALLLAAPPVQGSTGEVN